jgi:hypothetical protein
MLVIITFLRTSNMMSHTLTQVGDALIWVCEIPGLADL